MGIDNASYGITESPLDDIAYLARSEHRVPTLVALTERPRSRSELCELAGVSSSTVRRTLGEFEDRTWIRNEGYQYVATSLGAAIAVWMEDLIERVENERKLRDVWHWLPDSVCEFPIGTWEELNVTVADPDAPYRPVDRFELLLQKATKVRYLRSEIALMDPCFDVLRHRIHDGADITVISRPSCNEYFYSNYSESDKKMLQRDNFTVLEHDDLPSYGIGVLDEHAIITCHEQESGTVQALVDTDVPSVHQWVQSTYESYTSDARPFTPKATVE